MKQATTRKKHTSLSFEEHSILQMQRRVREGICILFSSFAIYLFIALFTYNESDSAWSHSGISQETNNAAGKMGAFFSDVLFFLFGYVSYLFPFVFMFCAFLLYKSTHHTKNPSLTPLWWTPFLGGGVALVASCGLMSMWFPKLFYAFKMGGGVLGQVLQESLVPHFNALGSTLILLAFLLSGITLFTGFSWVSWGAIVSTWFSRYTLKFTGYLNKQIQLYKAAATSPEKGKKEGKRSVFSALRVGGSTANVLQEKVEKDLPKRQTDIFSRSLKKVDIISAKKRTSIDSLFALEDKGLHDQKSVLKAGALDKVLPHSATNKVITKKKHTASALLPALDLLERTEKQDEPGYTEAQLQALSELVEARLLEFGVEVKVVAVLPGPVITRFEIDLAPGIKVSKISGLAKDLARSLSVRSVRVVEVIPGKPVVGLEIPNVHRVLVGLRNVLEDLNYGRSTSPLSLALGKDIAGRPVVADLAKMPHLLVAGTTGSGKSVGLNGMLLSILYKATPQEVRLILIDPKMLELAVYHDIPHLLTPVVTDMKDAANALRWCVSEMERRYQLMAAVGVRNLFGYNQKITKAQASGKPMLDPLWPPQVHEPAPPLEPFPYIVVVIDEFADMIMVVGKKVEELIARIAQKARAAGIHLILATQRPSVDVITGLIKANIPTRIAFQVSSRIDSRTILDQSGAEQLLGHGDMLYLPPGVGLPQRVHGAFVSDEEVHKVADALRETGSPTYIESVVQSTVNLSSSALDGNDEFYDKAVQIVTESKRASISLVQRRLKIGYNRAARLIEEMEAQGIVSALQSNGTREVLVSSPMHDEE